MGLPEGQSIGQTLDLVLKLVVVSPVLSCACPFAAHATRKKLHLACAFSSGPTCEKRLNSSSFGKRRATSPFLPGALRSSVPNDFL